LITAIKIKIKTASETVPTKNNTLLPTLHSNNLVFDILSFF